MRFREYVDKHIWTIVTIIATITAILSLVVLRIDASRNIEDQIISIYEKERLVRQDFSAAYELSGVTCYINAENNVFIFKDDDCSLKVTYNKNGELLTKVFEDSRIGNNFWGTAIFMFSIGGLAFMTSLVVFALLDALLLKLGQKRLAKKNKQETVDENILN